MAIVLLDCHGQLRIIGKKVNITLYDEVLKFVDQLAKNRSSFINDVL
jgi:hypothetical protein